MSSWFPAHRGVLALRSPEGFTKPVSLSRRGREIRPATALCPGYIATDMTVGETEVSREDMTQPDDLAEMVETLLRLPNNLSVAELLVNCRKEAML